MGVSVTVRVRNALSAGTARETEIGLFPFLAGHTAIEEGSIMKKEERQTKPVPWEVADPKPPVIQSGHMENRLQN